MGGLETYYQVQSKEDKVAERVPNEDEVGGLEVLLVSAVQVWGNIFVIVGYTKYISYNEVCIIRFPDNSSLV